jgi:subtilisin family serine protease
MMRAIKYVIEKAQGAALPLAVNISYGTNNGPHDGNSLFEAYIDDMSEMWKTVIIVAAGNEGAAGHHFSGKMRQDELLSAEFVVAANLNSLYLTLWKNFADTFSFELISPNGVSSGEIVYGVPLTVMQTDGTNIYISYGRPTRYHTKQEVFFQFAGERAIPPGIWRLTVRGVSVVSGGFDIWLPTTEEVSADTAFMQPTVSNTLTLPSTSVNVISVGGYNSALGSAAPFSGRGGNNLPDNYAKPDLVAPATAILTARPGGGYGVYTGTSMAAPFVAGAAALMMEWGIHNGNDPFLYGQRVKAFLRRGAKRFPTESYPNPVWGYGALCVKNVIDELAAHIGD